MALAYPSMHYGKIVANVGSVVRNHGEARPFRLLERSKKPFVNANSLVINPHRRFGLGTINPRIVARSLSPDDADAKVPSCEEENDLWRRSLVAKLSSAAAVSVTSVAIAVALLLSVPLDTEAAVLAPGRSLQDDERATVELFRNSTPSVVYVTGIAARTGVFSVDVMSVPVRSASGFIWDKKGHVVTTYHNIQGVSDLQVTLGDQSVYEADVVGYDQYKDVAVLHINAPPEKLRPLPVGTSYDLLVGQKVFVIGNPFGLDHTLTAGVISGLRREENSSGRPIQDAIQSDAATNPGSSGGPLLDSSGKLIGIHTSVYSGASCGVGFSIPADTVRGIVDQIVTYGKVTRPVLGISFTPEQSVKQLGVSGVLVLDAPSTGPAGKAGLVPGDIITSVNGKKIFNGRDLYRILDRCNVGDTVKLELLCGDQKVGVDVTLEPSDG